MRFAMSTIMVIVGFLQLSSNAIAQDFLQELDRQTKAAVSEYNARFVSEQLYFAKRHRLVGVNSDLLRESTINDLLLFEGEEKIGLRRERMQESQIHGAATWIGNITLPAEILAKEQWSKAEIEQIEKSGFTLEQFISQVSRVELQILYWDIDSTTGEAYPSAERRDEQVGPTPIAGAPVGDVKKHAFTSVRGQIDLSILGRGIYRLEPLRGSPKYHILYEVDPTKTFGVVEENSNSAAAVSDEGQRKLDYDEFLKSLSPGAVVVTKGDL